jgi:hypothetical protein
MAGSRAAAEKKRHSIGEGNRPSIEADQPVMADQLRAVAAAVAAQRGLEVLLAEHRTRRFIDEPLR